MKQDLIAKYLSPLTSIQNFLKLVVFVPVNRKLVMMLHRYPRANVSAIYHISAIEPFQVTALTKIGIRGHPMSRIEVTFGLFDAFRNSNELWPHQIVRKLPTICCAPFTRPGYPCFLYVHDISSRSRRESSNYIREVGQCDQSPVFLGESMFFLSTNQHAMDVGLQVDGLTIVYRVPGAGNHFT
jgi:hypothetical protein